MFKLNPLIKRASILLCFLSISVYGYSQNNGDSKSVENSWRAYFTKNSNFENVTPYAANVNVGIGFLYFAGSRGAPFGVTANYSFGSGTWTNDHPFEGRWKYNKTLLKELSMVWNLGGTLNCCNWLGLGLSVLNQGGVTMSYNPILNVAGGSVYFIYKGSLDLNAIVGKFFVYSPWSLIWKGNGYSPYLGLSVGPSWQTWRDLKKVDVTLATTTYYNTKYSANCFFGSELGVKVRSLVPNVNLSGMFGLKFNLWGQARSMGFGEQETARDGDNGSEYALWKPIKIKTVYQWSPFIGILFSY